MVMHGCLRPRERNNGDRLVSTISLSMECPMPTDSRIPTGRAFSAVLWASDHGEGGLGDGEELLGCSWEFCHCKFSG